MCFKNGKNLKCEICLNIICIICNISFIIGEILIIVKINWEYINNGGKVLYFSNVPLIIIVLILHLILLFKTKLSFKTKKNLNIIAIILDLFSFLFQIYPIYFDTGDYKDDDLGVLIFLILEFLFILPNIIHLCCRIALLCILLYKKVN